MIQFNSWRIEIESKFTYTFFYSPQEFADLLTLTEEMCNGILHFFAQCYKQLGLGPNLHSWLYFQDF